MKPCYDIIVAGAGMAGLSAVSTLAGRKLDILIIDENPGPGGQLLRKMGTRHGFEPDRMKPLGFTLAQKISALAADPCQALDRIYQARVLGIFRDNRLLVHARDPGGRERVHEVRARYLVLATGARERYLPFPGWTLPGVISLGAAQILIKSHGILPARDVLIGGSSPLQMTLAAEVLNNRGRVPALLNEAHPARQLALLPQAARHWPKLAQGAFYLARILKARTRMMNRVRIREARGCQSLEAVVTVRTTAVGQAIPGTETVWPASALCVGYGFSPNIELAGQAGCDLVHDPDLGGWVVRVDRYMASSVPGIYAVGEITGIGGGKKSWIQGRMAGLAILDRLGKVRKDQHYRKTVQDLEQQNQDQTAWARCLNRLCRVPGPAYAAIPDETLICRCEEITMAEIRKRVLQGFDTAGALKKATRCGMGRCQGRICSPVILDIVTALTGEAPGAAGLPRFRAPVKNVGMGAFLNGSGR